MEGMCCAAVPGSQSLLFSFTQGTDTVHWLHSLCQLCVLYLCCALSARTVEMLCRCCLNPFPLSIDGGGQGLWELGREEGR